MSSFWKNKKVLVVGGAGFIGSHTVDALIERGARVAVIDRHALPKRKYSNNPPRLYKLDATSSAAVGRIFRREKPEFVMNFAALVSVPRSILEPQNDARSITAMLNILENSVKFRVKKILYSSSGFIYGNAERLPTPESSPMQPLNPYNISKAACESYLRFFQAQHNLPFVILRYATVYGPRRTGGAMPDYIRKIISGAPVEIYGKKTRDYIFISDVVRANLMALEKSIGGVEPVFNIGSGKETGLRELHDLIAKLLGKGRVKPRLLPALSGEVDRMRLDVRKAKRALGFAAHISLKAGLAQTIAWHAAEINKIRI